MFLNELNKKESIAFINLVKILANTDNVLAKKEKDLLDEYIEELSLTNEVIGDLNFECAVKELSGSPARIENIIYFELVGLALADGVYKEKEIQFLNELANLFNINKEKQEAYINYFKHVTDSYENTFIEYESKINLLKEEALWLLDN